VTTETPLNDMPIWSLPLVLVVVPAVVAWLWYKIARKLGDRRDN
jgi:hypothetical protein